MNINSANAMAFKLVCLICCGLLFLLGLKILSDLLFVKGTLALVCSGILGLVQLQKPSIGAWLQVMVVIAVAVMIIGELKGI